MASQNRNDLPVREVVWRTRGPFPVVRLEEYHHEVTTELRGLHGGQSAAGAKRTPTTICHSDPRSSLGVSTTVRRTGR